MSQQLVIQHYQIASVILKQTCRMEQSIIWKRESDITAAKKAYHQSNKRKLKSL